MTFTYLINFNCVHSTPLLRNNESLICSQRRGIVFAHVSCHANQERSHTMKHNFMYYTMVIFTLLFISCGKFSCDKEPTTGTIQGRVTDGHGAVADASVSTDPATISSPNSDQDGRFIIAKVRPDQYTVTATFDSLIGNKTITVVAGETSTVQIRLGYNPVIPRKVQPPSEQGVTSGKETQNGSPSLRSAPPKGRVAYYTFSDGVRDESGNRNDGTANGSTSLTQRFQNGACSFNGIDDYLQIPDAPAFHNLNVVTLSVSFKPNARIGAWAKLVGKHHDGASGSFYLIWEGNYVRFSAITPSQYGGIVSGNLLDGNWHHACGVYDGHLLSLYVDGHLVSSSPNSGPIKETSYPITMGRSESWNQYYNGLIGDVQIYNRALAPSEVTQLYGQIRR